MEVKLKRYKNPHNYSKGFEDDILTEIEGKPLTVNTALKYAKEKIAEVRGTTKYVGFKIFDKHNQLKHKLPC